MVIVIQRHEELSDHWCLQSSRIFFLKRPSTPAWPVHFYNGEGELHGSKRGYKGMTNTVVKEGRVKADNCCKTPSPLLPHAQEIRAVKSLGWALVMTFQISSSTAMQISGTKSYHSLCGNPSRSSAQRQGSKAGTWFCHNKPSLATVTSLPGNLANKQTHPLALPPRWHAEPMHAEKQGKSPGTEELWDARWPW